MATRSASTIRFSAKLLRPRAEANGEVKPNSRGWTFLILPMKASAKLPSRGQVSVDGVINGAVFRATLQPDGNGGHWLKVDRTILLPLPSGPRNGRGEGVQSRRAPKLEAGEIVTLEITPVPPELEPEPEVPADLRKALAGASKKAREVWADITPAARRDFIHWITSGKRAETRLKRIATACDMLAKGKRRPCCFDRSGMYGKSMSCPVAES